MNPWPVMRTQILVLGIFLRRLSSQLMGFFIAALGICGMVAAGLAIKEVVFAGSALKSLGTQDVILAFLAGLAGLICLTSTAGLLWRRHDRQLLAGAPVGGFPFWLLLEGAIYAALVLGGAGFIIWVVLHYLPPHLESLGLPSLWSLLVLLVPLGLIATALALRLALLLPLIGLDRQRVTSGWHLILRTCVGKSLALLGGLILRLIVISPFLLVLYLVVWPPFEHTSFSQIGFHEVWTNPGIFAVGVLLLAGAYLVFTVLQAATLRHFFGYGIGGDPRYDDEHIVLPAPEEYGQNSPELVRSEEPILMSPSLTPAFEEPVPMPFLWESSETPEKTFPMPEESPPSLGPEVKGGPGLSPFLTSPEAEEDASDEGPRGAFGFDLEI